VGKSQLVVDISDVMDLKIKALACHASQFADFAGVEKRIRERAAELGKAERLRLRGDVRPGSCWRDDPLLAGAPERAPSRSAPSPATNVLLRVPAYAITPRFTSWPSRSRR